MMRPKDTGHWLLNDVVIREATIERGLLCLLTRQNYFWH